jgi:hypothetical protein
MPQKGGRGVQLRSTRHILRQMLASDGYEILRKKLGVTSRARFFVNGLYMGANGIERYLQMLRDLLVGISADREHHHFLLGARKSGSVVHLI